MLLSTTARCPIVSRNTDGLYLMAAEYTLTFTFSTAGWVAAKKKEKKKAGHIAVLSLKIASIIFACKYAFRNFLRYIVASLPCYFNTATWCERSPQAKLWWWLLTL